MPDTSITCSPCCTPSAIGCRRTCAARASRRSIHYPIPIPRQPALRRVRPARCPIADRVCDELVSLPLHPALSRSTQARHVAAAVHAFVPVTTADGRTPEARWRSRSSRRSSSASFPGRSLFRLPGARRARRARRLARRRARCSGPSSSASLVADASSLVLASLGRYHFERAARRSTRIACRLSSRCRGRRRLAYRGTAKRLDGIRAFLPLLIVALGVVAVLPTRRSTSSGGKDPGTYINEGIQIAQRGAPGRRRPGRRHRAAPFRDLFFPSHERRRYYGLRFMGFFIQDPRAGHGRRPVSAPVSRVDCDRLRPERAERRAAGRRRVDASSASLGVYFLGRAAVRTRAGAAAAARCSPSTSSSSGSRAIPNAEVVMHGAALRGAARLRARARRRRPVLRRRRGRAARCCSCSCAFDAVLAIGGRRRGGRCSRRLARPPDRRVRSGSSLVPRRRARRAGTYATRCGLRRGTRCSFTRNQAASSTARAARGGRARGGLARPGRHAPSRPRSGTRDSRWRMASRSWSRSGSTPSSSARPAGTLAPHDADGAADVRLVRRASRSLALLAIAGRRRRAACSGATRRSSRPRAPSRCSSSTRSASSRSTSG